MKARTLRDAFDEADMQMARALGKRVGATPREPTAYRGSKTDILSVPGLLLCVAVLLATALVGGYWSPSVQAKRAAEADSAARFERWLEGEIPATNYDMRAYGIYFAQPWVRDTSESALAAVWRYSHSYWRMRHDTTMAGLRAAIQPALDSLHRLAAVQVRDSLSRTRH